MISFPLMGLTPPLFDLPWYENVSENFLDKKLNKAPAGCQPSASLEEKYTEGLKITGTIGLPSSPC